MTGVETGARHYMSGAWRYGSHDAADRYNGWYGQYRIREDQAEL